MQSRLPVFDCHLETVTGLSHPVGGFEHLQTQTVGERSCDDCWGHLDIGYGDCSCVVVDRLAGCRVGFDCC